jgi:hypothetical protein
MIFLLLLCISDMFVTYLTDCICTTVPCPIQGHNTVIMGEGGANITYTYNLHETNEVVVSAYGTVTPESLDKGTETTSCTQKYSRMLEDDGNQDCDAGHILANRLGGYGNLPINIFPQDASTNRGSYAQFEGNIYDCMKNGSTVGHLSWTFDYESASNTMPKTVKYTAEFENGDCRSLCSHFPN